MALSLADELASAFDDPHDIQVSTGQSLAAEFGEGLDHALNAEFECGNTNPPYSPHQHTKSLSSLPQQQSRNDTPARTRTAKSSSSSTVVAPSIYSELGDDTVHIPDLPYSPIPIRKQQQNAISTPPPKLRAEVSPSSFINPKFERDPVTVLQESLDHTAHFLKQLQGYENDDGKKEDDLIAGMEQQLEAMTRSEKVREEQCKELSGIIRSVEGLDTLDTSLMGSGGLGLGVFNTIDEDVGVDVNWSWQKHLSIATSTKKSTQGEVAATDSGKVHDDRELKYDNPLNHSLDSKQSVSLSQSGSETAIDPLDQPELPRSLRAQSSHTETNLHTSLLSLLETISHNTSFSTEINRQLKKSKAFTQSWREREALVESAKRRVDIWEGERLERGLKGVWMGDGLKCEVEGLERVLEIVELRMQSMTRVRPRV